MGAQTPCITTDDLLTSKWGILGSIAKIEFQNLASCSDCMNSIDDFGFSAVPVPAAAWLFGSGLVGLIGVARRRLRT